MYENDTKQNETVLTLYNLLVQRQLYIRLIIPSRYQANNYVPAAKATKTNPTSNITT